MLQELFKLASKNKRNRNKTSSFVFCDGNGRSYTTDGFYLVSHYDGRYDEECCYTYDEQYMAQRYRIPLDYVDKITSNLPNQLDDHALKAFNALIKANKGHDDVYMTIGKNGVTMGLIHADDALYIKSKLLRKVFSALGKEAVITECHYKDKTCPIKLKVRLGGTWLEVIVMTTVKE